MIQFQAETHGHLLSRCETLLKEVLYAEREKKESLFTFNCLIAEDVQALEKDGI